MRSAAASGGGPGPESEPRRARGRKRAEVLALLERHGVLPSRYRGQRFLLDGNLAAAIARDAALSPGEHVLEIGVGWGALTEHLLGPDRRVLGVELEPRLAAAAREHLGDVEGLELLVGDALAGKHRLAPSLLGRLPSLTPYVLVSNLPYAVAGPLLVEFARAPCPPRRMVVLVQWELAERLLAEPGARAYGPLSAALGAAYGGELLRPVPPEVFWPRPRVRSALLRLVPRSDRLVGEAFERHLRVVHRLFRWPRKSLRAVLRLLGVEDPEEILRRAGARPEARPGDLDGATLRRIGDCAPGAFPAEKEGGEGWSP